jgi:threonine dehydrogenase-like Zn-dependent dehydrogenase
MGHEYCAEVVDYGPDTERRIPVGARVSSLPVLSTPTGRKIIGQNPESPGGFGEYFLITEAMTRVVASDLPSEVVCVADAISASGSTPTSTAPRNNARCSHRHRLPTAGVERASDATVNLSSGGIRLEDE